MTILPRITHILRELMRAEGREPSHDPQGALFGLAPYSP